MPGIVDVIFITILFNLLQLIECTDDNGVCISLNGTKACCVDYYRENENCVVCPDGRYGKDCFFECPDGYFGSKCRSQCRCPTYFCNKKFGCDCPDGSRGSDCKEDPRDLGSNIFLIGTLCFLGLVASIIIVGATLLIRLKCLKMRMTNDLSVATKRTRRVRQRTSRRPNSFQRRNPTIQNWINDISTKQEENHYAEINEMQMMLDVGSHGNVGENKYSREQELPNPTASEDVDYNPYNKMNNSYNTLTFPKIPIAESMVDIDLGKSTPKAENNESDIVTKRSTPSNLTSHVVCPEDTEKVPGEKFQWQKNQYGCFRIENEIGIIENGENGEKQRNSNVGENAVNDSRDSGKLLKTNMRSDYLMRSDYVSVRNMLRNQEPLKMAVMRFGKHGVKKPRNGAKNRVSRLMTQVTNRLSKSSSQNKNTEESDTETGGIEVVMRDNEQRQCKEGDQTKNRVSRLVTQLTKGIKKSQSPNPSANGIEESETDAVKLRNESEPTYGSRKKRKSHLHRYSLANMLRHKPKIKIDLGGTFLPIVSRKSGFVQKCKVTHT